MMTLQEVATWLRVHQRTIRRWIVTGIPAVNVGSAARPDWRFDRVKVLEWLEAGKPERIPETDAP